MKKNQKGQTIIEFALVSIVFVFMLVLTVNATLAFSVQQYLSYAAFMGARAYQASSQTKEESQSRAIAEMARFIPGLREKGSNLRDIDMPLTFLLFAKPLAKIKSISFPVPTDGLIGQDRPVSGLFVRIDFDVPLVQFPLSQQLSDKFAKIGLTAESYLGRELSQTECRTFFDKFLLLYAFPGGSASNLEASRTNGKFMEDNGC